MLDRPWLWPSHHVGHCGPLRAIAGLNKKDDPYIDALDVPGYNYAAH